MATNGCIRLYPEDMKKLYESTPVATPVCIVNQPYLIGQRGGVVYLESHGSLDDSNSVEREKVCAKLRALANESARPLDWSMVYRVLDEARGIPVPVYEIYQGSSQWVDPAIELKHPAALYGKPEIPELKTAAWYVLAATLKEEIDAVRMAAIINHQGPQIPARVLSMSDTYRVIAGPFNDVGDAKDAAKRLKIDLEIDGILMDPVNQK
jgi:L,D-transpeptidase ErfK/SrfK